MTQKALRKKLIGYFREQDIAYIISNADIDFILQLINQHVREVIGEDEPNYDHTKDSFINSRNELRAKQRKRAEL